VLVHSVGPEGREEFWPEDDLIRKEEREFLDEWVERFGDGATCMGLSCSE
jgi:hypothetical protein